MNYLDGRKMRLKCHTNESRNYTYSAWYKLTHSTPQGSCLEPLPFLIFCNNLRQNLEYLSCIQFADDTTLFYADKNLDVIKCCVEHCRGITWIHRLLSRPRPSIRLTAAVINIHEHPI